MIGQTQPDEARHRGQDAEEAGTPDFQGRARGGDDGILGGIRRPPLQEALKLRESNPEEYTEKSFDTMAAHVEAMLDRVATAIQRALQANSTVGMACHLLSPAVGLVDNRLELFQGERWLRDEFAVPPYP